MNFEQFFFLENELKFRDLVTDDHFALPRTIGIIMVVFVCLHITLLHYHHYSDVSESIELLKKSQFSQSSFIQYTGLYVFSLLISPVVIVRIHVRYLIIIIKSEV